MCKSVHTCDGILSTIFCRCKGKEYCLAEESKLYEEVDSMGLMVELVTMDMVLSNLDVTYVKLIFTLTIGSHFKLGIY